MIAFILFIEIPKFEADTTELYTIAILKRR